MRVLRHVFALGMATVVFGASRAHAIDPSISLSEAAGSVCQPIAGAGTPGYSDFGVISNQHTTQTLAVDCPIPFLVDDDYGDELDVWIKVKGNGGHVFCTVFVEQITTYSSLPAYYLASASTSANAVTDLSVDIDVFEGLSAGAMHVYCTLPPKNANGAVEVRSFMTMD